MSVIWRVLAHSTTTGKLEGSQRRDIWATVTPTAYRRRCSRVSSDVSLSRIFLNFMAISMNLINQVFFVICSRSKLVTPKNTQLQPGFISKSVIQKNTLHQFSSTTQTKNLQQRNSDTEQATIRFRHQVIKSLGDRKMHNKRLRGHGNN